MTNNGWIGQPARIANSDHRPSRCGPSSVSAMAGWTSPPLPARWGASNRSTFVGRGRELAALADAWELSAQGARQVVFIGGEAGVGKSRIVAETAGDLHRQQAAVLVGTCASSMGAPYQPFVEPTEALLSAVVSGQLTI